MKTVKYIDILIQGLMIAFGVGASVAIVFTNHRLTAAGFYVQLLLCLWQFLSAFISMIWQWSSAEPRRYYLIFVTLFLAMLPVLGLRRPNPTDPIALISTSIALWYFFISVRSMKWASTTGRGFLPHLGF